MMTTQARPNLHLSVTTNRLLRRFGRGYRGESSSSNGEGMDLTAFLIIAAVAALIFIGYAWYKWEQDKTRERVLDAQRAEAQLAVAVVGPENIDVISSDGNVQNGKV